MSLNRRFFTALLATPAVPVLAQAGPDAALQAAIDGPQRSAAYRARDAARHPYETLRFFGLQPTHRVIELAPGGGWYTEILAPYLRDRARFVAIGESDRFTHRYRKPG